MPVAADASRYNYHGTRENHIQKKIKAQLLDAKAKSQAKDKRGALFALKRKKMYEGEVNKLNGARMTLESQVLLSCRVNTVFHGTQ